MIKFRQVGIAIYKAWCWNKFSSYLQSPAAFQFFTAPPKTPYTPNLNLNLIPTILSSFEVLPSVVRGICKYKIDRAVRNVLRRDSNASSHITIWPSFSKTFIGVWSWNYEKILHHTIIYNLNLTQIHDRKGWNHEDYLIITGKWSITMPTFKS